jgi:2-polyprenyl-6-methoxyphenol hydroxylase-like FAD-dependent oxidoreductase
MMLGFLLARAGVDVVVLEKHADFFRDFRGDTIHPSTLEVLGELGLLEEFLQIPHEELREVKVTVSGTSFRAGDFAHVPGRCKFIAFAPQWDFLSFLARHAQNFPGFRILMGAEVTELVEERGRIAGVRARTRDGELVVNAGLVVGADGRGSTVRERASLVVEDLGAPMDVLWMRIGKEPSDPAQSLGYVDAGRLLVLIDRRDYWQAGYVIPKGSFEALRAKGLDAFHERLVAAAPFLRGRVDALRSWDDVKTLTVKVDRLRTWHRPGLLCIGDAAHAMSPVGGVGINLAIQDAVAAANLLSPFLASRDPDEEDLDAVQRRREPAAKVTQGVQVFIHEHVLSSIFEATGPLRPPWILKLLDRSPLLRRLPARAVGIGWRPEHVRSSS